MIRHDMSLESLFFEFHEQRWDSCLSTESVVQSLGTPGCPRFPIPLVDRALLMELASYGMVVVEPPRSSPLVFRRSYLAVSTTVDKLFYKQWLIGLMLIIPTSMAVEIPGRWEGCGFRPSVRNAGGAIVLPNLYSIMTMILGVVDQEGISEVMLWSCKGLEGCLHTAALPSITVATVCPCGNFGWVGTPYAFNVVFRTLDVTPSMVRVSGTSTI